MWSPPKCCKKLSPQVASKFKGTLENPKIDFHVSSKITMIIVIRSTCALKFAIHKYRLSGQSSLFHFSSTGYHNLTIYITQKWSLWIVCSQIGNNNLCCVILKKEREREGNIYSLKKSNKFKTKWFHRFAITDKHLIYLIYHLMSTVHITFNIKLQF